MSTNHTPNYNLCQWEAGDQVLRADFNADNGKIDTAIKAVDRRVDSLAGTVSSQGSTLYGKGNCQIQLFSYVGTGEATHTIPLPRNTLLLVITSEGRTSLTAVRGTKQLVCIGGGGHGANINAVWTVDGLTLSFSAGDFTNERATCNELNTTYDVIALRSLS